MLECQTDKPFAAVFTMAREMAFEAASTTTKADLHLSTMHPIYDYDYGVFYTI